MTFEFTPTEDGFRIHDTIENAWSDVGVGRSVEPAPANTEPFRAPLDAAVTFDAETVTFSANFAVFVRDHEGTFIERGAIDGPIELASGSYELETSFMPFKLYILVADAEVTVHNHGDGAQLSFDHESEVTLGVRSYHQQPAGTVTATEDPRDLMRAISTFGSALQTLSPERSFPTLRGHPPELAIRGQCSIPDEFEPPETGITIEVPPSYNAIYTVAPLAYYLGASIKPGKHPSVSAASTVHEFDPNDLATDVAALLRHLVFLDCVVRTVGLYPVDLHETHRLAERTTIDARALYDRPIDSRTADYLDIPVDATSDLMAWPTVADVDPVPFNAEVLPYLAYRLAAIRSPTAGTTRPASHRTDTDPGPGGTPLDDGRTFLPGDTSESPTIVDPDPFDAARHLWIGDGVPVGGSKPTLGSYLRSIDSTPKDSIIDIHVVCARTDNPDTVRSHYRTAGSPDRPVTIHDLPTIGELQDLFTSDIDFLHYKGGATTDGLNCLDGTLDIRTLPEMNVSSFLLEGAESVQPGLDLIHIGGIAGAVTITGDSDERNTGHIIAELLDFGFPLGAAIHVLGRLESDTEYAVFGDADHQVCQPPTVPTLHEVRPEQDTDDITIRTTTYATRNHGVGTMLEIVGDAIDESRLLGTHDIKLPREDLDNFVENGDQPLIIDGDLDWLRDYTAQEIWDHVR